VFFELDGINVVARMERMIERFRSIIPLCCPPSPGGRAGSAKEGRAA